MYKGSRKYSLVAVRDVATSAYEWLLQQNINNIKIIYKGKRG